MPFPVDESNIEVAERSLGRELPPQHRRRLASDNGGDVRIKGYPGDDPWWTLHPVRDASDRRRLKRTMAHIVAETEEARQWARFPPDAVSIAENGTGDRIILSADSRYAWWDHETGHVAPVTVVWDDERRVQ